MLLNAFRTNEELFQKPLSLPQVYDLSIYQKAWEQASFSTAFLNSLLVTTCSVVLIMAASILAAFALARIKFRGNTFFLRLFTSSIVISGQVILIPLFFIIKNLGLYNNLASVILTGSAIGLPISITILYGFFKEIPLEIEEATQIDGCSKIRFLFSFVLPLSKPVLASVIIFQSLWNWNEYLYALTFLKDEPIRTIPIQLSVFFMRYTTEWNKLFAALSISIVPLLILYLFLQKYFIKGLAAGAVKL